MNKQTARILSIDAWGNAEDGFDWNNWFDVGHIDARLVRRSSDKALLEYLVREGYLKERARTECSMEDDCYNLVATVKATGEPLFAIEYGALY